MAGTDRSKPFFMTHAVFLMQLCRGRLWTLHPQIDEKICCKTRSEEDAKFESVGGKKKKDQKWHVKMGTGL